MWWIRTGCITVWPGSVELFSHPHNIPHYYVIAHRLGYGDDLIAYCREHDFFHNFCEQYFNDRPSPTLMATARGIELPRYASIPEEILVQTCQRWVRTNERPIVAGVDWDAFRREALDVLG
jgi:hypothetical protein